MEYLIFFSSIGYDEPSCRIIKEALHNADIVPTVVSEKLYFEDPTSGALLSLENLLTKSQSGKGIFYFLQNFLISVLKTQREG